MDRVGGYLPGDALFCTANTSAACVPVVFTHPFVHAPWPLGRAPRRPAVDPNAGPNTRPRVTIGMPRVEFFILCLSLPLTL